MLDFKDIWQVVPKFSNLYGEPELEVLWGTNKNLEKELQQKAEDDELFLTDGFGEKIKVNSFDLDTFIKKKLLS